MSDTVAIAAITATAGLGGAAIAAIAGRYRQKNELAHDREMRDLSEVRNRLDDVMDQGEQSLADMFDADTAFNEKHPDRCAEHLQSAEQKLMQLQALIRRIRLLYGDDEELIELLQAYLEKLERMHDLLESANEQSGEQDKDEVEQVASEAGEACLRVIEAASRSIGVRLRH